MQYHNNVMQLKTTEQYMNKTLTQLTSKQKQFIIYQ